MILTCCAPRWVNAPSAWHGHRSVHARSCRSARSADSACCRLSSSVFILTASNASLSSFSEDTLALHLGKKKCRITALQFPIDCLCAAYVALQQRSVPACLGCLEAAASHRILVSYALRGSLDGVPTGPFRCAATLLAFTAHAKLCPCVYCPY